MNSQDSIKVEIRYLNQTFRGMFTAFKEKLRQDKIAAKEAKKAKKLKAMKK